MLILMDVVGVRVEMPSNQPIVLLKEMEGSRFLPIWIGAVEATAIAFAQQGIEPPRPLTHDLMATLITTLDATLTAIHLTSIESGIFYASLQLRNRSAKLLTISARPSDAIALALRCKSNILASSELLDEVGIEMPAQGIDGEVGSIQEIERFKEFLDQINPEDFAK